MARAPAEGIRHCSGPCRPGRSMPRTDPDVWCRISPPTRTRTPVITLSWAVRFLPPEERAPSRRSMPGCSAAFGRKLGWVLPELWRNPQCFRRYHRGRQWRFPGREGAGCLHWPWLIGRSPSRGAFGPGGSIESRFGPEDIHRPNDGTRSLNLARSGRVRNLSNRWLTGPHALRFCFGGSFAGVLARLIAGACLGGRPEIIQLIKQRGSLAGVNLSPDIGSEFRIIGVHLRSSAVAIPGPWRRHSEKTATADEPGLFRNRLTIGWIDVGSRTGRLYFTGSISRDFDSGPDSWRWRRHCLERRHDLKNSHVQIPPEAPHTTIRRR